MAGTIAIELTDLHFFVKQGLYEEEGVVENELVVDLAIWYKAPKKPIRHIDQTINYAEVYGMVKDELSVRKALLETSAMQLCDRIADRFPFIKEISIRIQKMHAPIANFSGTVGVRYSRRFK